MIIEWITSKILRRVIANSDVEMTIDRFIDSGIIAAKDWLSKERKDPNTRNMWRRLNHGGLKSAVEGEIREIALAQCVLTAACFFHNAKDDYHGLDDIAFLVPAELCQINAAKAIYEKYHNINSMCTAIPDDNERALALLSLGYASVKALLVEKRIDLLSKPELYQTYNNKVAIVWGSKKDKNPIYIGNHADYFLCGNVSKETDTKSFDKKMIDFMANRLTKAQSDMAGKAWTDIIDTAAKKGATGHCPANVNYQEAYIYCNLSK